MRNFLYQEYKDGQLDDQVKNFLIELSKSDSKPMQQQTPEEVRKNSSILNWMNEKKKAHKIENIVISIKGSSIPIRIYIPEGNGSHPAVVYFHGGGWVFGSLDEADHICGIISNETPAIVVSVDYRLSPENKFPCAIEDGCAIILWIEKEITKYNGCPNLIAVAGESAGANIATVVCHMLRDTKGPQIRYQLLICPWVDLVNFDTASYKLFGEGI